MMKTIFGALGAFVVVVATASARAEECGNVSEDGLCQDPKTLLYCQDGELEQMDCGADEICVRHDFFGGSSGCVHTRYTGCGDITEAGTCVGDKLLYCQSDKVQERTCDQGWTCGVVTSDEGDYHDCVGQQGVSPSTPDDEGAEAPERIAAEDSAELESLGGQKDNAAPTVQSGGAGAVGETAGGGAGCEVGGGSVLAFALVGLLRRRRA